VEGDRCDIAELHREVKRTSLAVNVLIEIITRVLHSEQDQNEDGVVFQWTARVLSQLIILAKQAAILEGIIDLLNRKVVFTEGCRLRIEDIRFNTGHSGWKEGELPSLSHLYPAEDHQADELQVDEIALE